MQSLKNPSTTTGLCMVANVRDEIRKIQRLKDQKKQDKEEKAKESAVKNAEKTRADQEVLQSVLDMIEADKERWQDKLKLPQLKSVYTALGGKNVSVVGKKAEIVAKLEIMLAAKVAGGNDDDAMSIIDGDASDKNDSASDDED